MINVYTDGSRPLQLTSLLFLVPAAAALHHPLIAALLVLNAAVSFVVHSFDRNGRTLIDTADNTLVGIWVCVNAYLLQRSRFRVTPIICAVTVAVIAVSRLRWKKGDFTRNVMHGAIHAIGALGTLLLLL